MKFHYMLLLLVVTPCAGAGQSLASPQAAGFTLQITDHHVKGHSLEWDFDNTTDKSLRVGRSVVIAVRKTNISNHKIEKIVMPGWLWDVRDSSGDPVGPSKRRNPGGWILGGGPGVQRGTQEMFLQPSKSSIHWGDLSWGFDLSQPGTYTFQVSQHVSDNPKSPIVKSNVLTITLLPANAPAQRTDNTSPSPNASGTTPPPQQTANHPRPRTAPP